MLDFKFSILKIIKFDILCESQQFIYISKRIGVIIKLIKRQRYQKFNLKKSLKECKNWYENKKENGSSKN